MWDETLIESGQQTKARKRWVSVPISAMAHVLVVGTVIGLSYWSVEAVPPPPSREPIWVVKVDLGSPPAPIEQQKPSRSTRLANQASKVDPPQQPAINESQPDGPADNSAELSTSDTGSMNGVEGVDTDGEGGFLFGPGFTIGEEKPMVINAAMQQPVLIKKVTPIYPQVALRARIQGFVLLQAVITKTGTVEELTVIQTSHPLLADAAVDAVRKWQYRPAILSGRPVKVYFNVTVEFKIQ